MTVKLLLLKSGEDIISDVTEMVFGEGENIRVIGYYLNKPCVAKLKNPIANVDKNLGEECSSVFQLSLYPWIPLTDDEVIPLSMDWVVTMVTPNEHLKKMYNDKVLENGKNNQNSSIDEQSDSNQSN